MNAPAAIGRIGVALRECPLCQSDKVRLVKKSGVTGKVCHSRYYREHVECKNCGTRSGEKKVPGKAVSSWNRRTQPTDDERLTLRDTFISEKGLWNEFATTVLPASRSEDALRTIREAEEAS